MSSGEASGKSGDQSSSGRHNSSGGRHNGREVALQVLYAIDLGEVGPRDAAAARAAKPIGPGSPPVIEPLTGDGESPGSGVVGAGEVFDRVAAHFSVPGSAIEFARELVAGVSAEAAMLDEIVGEHARNWRVSRMAAVDRNVLRLAVWELRSTQTPIAVVIDEAVDLARRFGSDTSPAFVNGILDAVAKNLRAA